MFVMRKDSLLEIVLIFTTFTLTQMPANSQSPGNQAPAENSSTQSGAAINAPLLRVTSHAVILDVVVTNSGNHPVSDLQKRNFTVSEDGKPQSIVFFEPSHSNRDNQDHPRTILLLDELNTGIQDSAYARYCAEKFLKNDGRRLDLQTALMVLSDQGLHVATDYTRDSGVLLDALANLPPELPIRIHQQFYGALERINMSLQALQDIALANRASGKRQIVIWISPGFPVFPNLQMAIDQQQKLGVLLHNLSKQLLDGRVTLYTVDPRGSDRVSLADRVANTTSLADLSSAGKITFADAALQVIAVQSGGRAFYGRNDIDHEIAASIAEETSFYTISYYPSNGDFDGKFRRISIRLDRPGLNIHAREGYYAISDPPPLTQEQVEFQVQATLSAPLTFDSIPIAEDKAILSSNSKQGRFEFLIPGSAVRWTTLPNGNLQCGLVLGAASFSSPHAEPSHFVLRHYTVAFPGSKQEALIHGSFRVSIDIPLETTPLRLRFVVADVGTGLVGSTDITSFPPLSHTPLAPER